MKVSKKAILIASAAAAAAVSVPLALVAPGYITKRQKLPFDGMNFAHRGLHARDKSVPENSLTAFRLASEMGYGIELDVQLSKDGQVVVFHDDDLKRVCGVDKGVCELDYSELRQLRLCGTDEYIPLFTEVLETIAGRSPLIVELKTGARNRELCEKTYAILSTYRGDVCIESFNPLIVAWFRRHAKDLVRGQLAMPKKYYGDDVKPLQASLLSRCLLNFLARPQFIAYRIGPKPLLVKLCERMGAMRIAWTSHEPRNEKGNDGVIFEFYKPRLNYKKK